MDTQLAQAVQQLAAVHDRRLGEIAAALGRLADQMTHSDDPNKWPESGIDHPVRTLGDLGVTVSMENTDED